MRVDRKEQRDVDVDAVGDELTNCLGTLGGARHLDHQIGTIDDLPQASGLGHRAGRITREIGRDFERDVAVDRVGAVVHGAEGVAGVTDVGGGDQFEGLAIGPGAIERGQLRVVGGSLGEGLLEDRRVGRLPGEGVLADPSRQIAVGEHGPIDIVKPEGLSGRVQSVETSRHGIG